MRQINLIIDLYPEIHTKKMLTRVHTVVVLKFADTSIEVQLSINSQ